MVLDQILTNLDTLLFLVVFISFIIIAKKIIDTVFNLGIVSIASLIFPFVGNLLGFEFAIDINSLLTYIIIGTGLYLIYVMGKIIYKAFSLTAKTGKLILSPFKKKTNQ